MTPEAKVRDPTVTFAKRRGILHIRMHFGRGARTGYPDDLFVYPGGHHYWIEFKAGGKEPRPIQHRRIRQLRDQGVDVDWFDNADAACKAIASRMDAGAVSAAGSVPFARPAYRRVGA